MLEKSIVLNTLLHNVGIFYEWIEAMVLVDFGMKLRVVQGEE